MASDAAELLKQVPLFSDLDRKELEHVANAMKQRTFHAGQEIAVEGESAVGFFVIEDGQAKVTVRGEQRRMLGRQGRRPGPGSCFPYRTSIRAPHPQPAPGAHQLRRARA